MFNVGGGEMLAVLLLALLVLGPERLPKAVGEVGKWVGQLRRMSSGFQDELKKAMDAANLSPDDGDTPFAPGEEAHRALPPGIEEEVRVVHGSAGDAAPVADPSDAEPGDSSESVDDAPAPSDGDASVTPLHPRRDDETRATG
jgi:sec-independent protein translocase protein TatB